MFTNIHSLSSFLTKSLFSSWYSTSVPNSALLLKGGLFSLSFQGWVLIGLSQSLPPHLLCWSLSLEAGKGQFIPDGSLANTGPLGNPGTPVDQIRLKERIFSSRLGESFCLLLTEYE